MQVVSFALSAVYSCLWFTRWARDSVKNRMWPQLGWFSGLVCVGSVAGAVAWGANAESYSLVYQAETPGLNELLSRRQSYALLSSQTRWYAAFVTLYGLEFLCFIVPKLIMLGRLTNNAARRCVTCDACV